MTGSKPTLKSVIGTLQHLETGLLTAMLGLMVVLAFGQIILRNLFSVPLLWADPLLRHLVLWVGMLGAALATKDGRHIRIDVLPQILPPRGKTALAAFTELFSSVICTLLAWAALKFVRDEMEFGGNVFLEIPSWIVQIILPAGFALISVRFFLRAVMQGRAALRNEIPEETGGDRS